MMDGYGQLMGEALITLAVVAFICGVVTMVGGWALWHFVLSHISFVWR